MRKDTSFSVTKTINLRGHILDFSVPRVMGILNLTPDSFYDGGKYLSGEDILRHAGNLINRGADIIDVGACSSRPGAPAVTVEEEIKRLRKGLKVIRSAFPDIPLSVDTFRSAVAEMAVREFDVNMVNDISAGELDPAMFDVIGGLNVAYVMMHMQGTPQNMQDHPQYDHVVKDILKYFSRKLSRLYQMGVKDVIVDPGFGFGKTVEHNYQLLKGLSAFGMFGVPLMVGLSRKSMIWKVLGTGPDEALNGTTVLHTVALLGGADILRVHDPHEAKEAIELVNRFNLTQLPEKI